MYIKIHKYDAVLTSDIDTPTKSSSAGQAEVYAGVFDALRTIVREEGPTALYKGFVPIVVRKVPGWARALFYSRF